MKYWICCIFVTCFSAIFGVETEEKTVLLAILARNKAHVLPFFLHCIDELEYDKQKITLYINTNNNQDNTAELLEHWISDKGSAYREVIFENHEITYLSACSPHAWTPERFKVLGAIRNRSMDFATSTNSDFYFVIDCDNFIAPSTLRDLVEHDKPIIAPMLQAIPNKEDYYSNFFCAVDELGYWKSSEEYLAILYGSKVGVFEVPLVHCTYLIQSRHIPELTYIDGTDDYEFVIFSRIARERGIQQYICNEKHFGYVLHPPEDITLEEEARLIDQIPELLNLSP